MKDPAHWLRSARNGMFARIKWLLSALSAALTSSFVVLLETSY